MILNVSPTGKVLNKDLRKYSTLIYTSTLIWMDNWPEEAFKEIGKVYLDLGKQGLDKGLLPEDIDDIQKDELVTYALRIHLEVEYLIDQ